MWPFDLPLKRERKIADALANGAELSGYFISEITGLGPGSLYATLQRMERGGRVVSRWGVATPERGAHRPRLYRLKTINHGE